MTYRYVFALGAAMTPANLEALATPVFYPKSTYSPYTSVVGLSDGSTRGIGAPTATWRWGFLNRDMRDQLRSLCTGASAEVYIRTYTKDNAGAPKYFLARMTWPSIAEETDNTKAIDFVIKFTQLVLQADP